MNLPTPTLTGPNNPNFNPEKDRGSGKPFAGANEEQPRLSDDIIRVASAFHTLGTFVSPVNVVGRSGVKHMFSFGFRGPDGENVVCDCIESSEPVDETKVLSLFIKVYDVGAKHAILCAVPSLTFDAKKLSLLYKIITVESRDAAKLPELISQVLDKIDH